MVGGWWTSWQQRNWIMLITIPTKSPTISPRNIHVFRYLWWSKPQPKYHGYTILCSSLNWPSDYDRAEIPRKRLCTHIWSVIRCTRRSTTYDKIRRYFLYQHGNRYLRLRGEKNPYKVYQLNHTHFRDCKALCDNLVKNRTKDEKIKVLRFEKTNHNIQ